MIVDKLVEPTVLNGTVHPDGHMTHQRVGNCARNTVIDIHFITWDIAEEK